MTSAATFESKMLDVMRRLGAPPDMLSDMLDVLTGTTKVRRNLRLPSEAAMAQLVQAWGILHALENKTLFSMERDALTKADGEVALARRLLAAAMTAMPDDRYKAVMGELEEVNAVVVKIQDEIDRWRRNKREKGTIDGDALEILVGKEGAQCIDRLACKRLGVSQKVPIGSVKSWQEKEDRAREASHWRTKRFPSDRKNVVRRTPQEKMFGVIPWGCKVVKHIVTVREAIKCADDYQFNVADPEARRALQLEGRKIMTLLDGVTSAETADELVLARRSLEDATPRCSRTVYKVIADALADVQGGVAPEGPLRILP